MENKHAFLIGCYQYPNLVEELIGSLDGSRSNIYVHVNKKYLDEFQSMKKNLQSRQNVFFVDSIDVRWGGVSFLRSVKIMLDTALNNSENTYFHLLSGQDALCRPLHEIYEFFDEHPNNNFLSKSADCSVDKHFLSFVKYYHLYDLIDVRAHKFALFFERFSEYVQKYCLFFLHRKLPYKKMYKGAGWFSLNRDGAETLFNAMLEPDFNKKWYYTFATEELFVHSVLRNSNKNLNIVNNYHRYIYWDYSRKLLPATLDESYYTDIVTSKAFFCRKVSPEKSKILLDMLHKICIR